mmetsp:Transcript_70952/g.160572  ORF Transcript_70952/g.160572 Transcript_70952/m.160572 type:complete len:118 (-) Transcript_70952:240-593(-)
MCCPDGLCSERGFEASWEAVYELPRTGDEEGSSGSEEDTGDDDGSPDDDRSLGKAREEIDEVKALLTQKRAASKDSGNPHDPCSAEPADMLGAVPKIDEACGPPGDWPDPGGCRRTA